MVRHGGNIFAVAEAARVDFRQVLDFSASINPLGMSPTVKEAILTAMDRVAHYPERTGRRVREALGSQWGVGPERIRVGHGATELLYDWCREQGNGTIAAPAFGEFHAAWPEARICALADRGSWPTEGAVVLITRIVTLLAVGGLVLATRSGMASVRGQVPVLALMGVLDALALGLVIVAGGLPSAEYAAITSSLFGVITILLAWRFLGEAVARAQWIGVAVVFAGIGVLAAQG